MDETELSHPRLGSSGASTIPRIWICSINARKNPVKGKTQNVDEFFTMCPYLVVHILRGPAEIHPTLPGVFGITLVSHSAKAAYVILREKMFRNHTLTFFGSKILSSYRLLKISALPSTKIHRTVRNRTQRARFTERDENFQIDFIACHRILPLSFAANWS